MNHTYRITENIKEKNTPFSEEAEQYILGGILHNNEGFYKVCDFLLPEHFFIETHKSIYETITTLIQSGKTASPITVKEFICDIQSTCEISGMSPSTYMFKISLNSTSILNLKDYGKLIKDLYIRRNLITLGENIINCAYDNDIDAPTEAQIAEAEKNLYNLSEKGTTAKGFVKLSKAIRKSVQIIEMAKINDGSSSGINSGFQSIDNHIGGFQPSDLIVIAGRPGMGKTALVTNIAHNIASSNGGHVGFFSLEMSAEQLATRIISSETKICSSDMKKGKINDYELEKIKEEENKLQTVPLYIDDSAGLSISQISTRARRLKRQIGLDLLIIDYIQLIIGSNKNGFGNRVQEITEITNGLKVLAKDLNIPILALSQLSRNVENRECKRPQLSDLRDSGSIEQDADMVMFVYREEYYLHQSKPNLEENPKKYAEWENKMNNAEGKAEIIIAKQRHGATGTVNLKFEGSLTKFFSA